ncbi:MAG: efflux RND transporter periplasmic adaptor subunit, partial [Flavobacteriales bacterium]|nr:efflux RND transporter periplasmic adaptor subunit [Flavobacteriales bacterium]
MAFTWMRIFIAISILMVFFSCGNDSTDINDSFQATQEFRSKPTQVKITYPKLGTFNNELIANGKLFAAKKVDLRFKLTEPLESILVSNGDYVNRNQIIATQQQFTLKNNLAKVQEEFTKAKIELENILLEYKYSLEDSLNIPKQIFEIAKNKANYTTAQLNLINSQYELSTSVLKAPFS